MPLEAVVLKAPELPLFCTRAHEADTDKAEAWNA